MTDAVGATISRVLGPVHEASVADLVPYARNARQHSEAQISQLMAAINEFGFIVPVLIDDQGGIMAGHARVLAAQRLGMTKVPAIQVDHLSPAQRRAFILADNKLAAMATWDVELVKLELQDLVGMEYAVELTGFAVDDPVLMEHGVQPVAPEVVRNDKVVPFAEAKDRFLLMLEFPDEGGLKVAYEEMIERGFDCTILS